jgi:hypothetical protein
MSIRWVVTLGLSPATAARCGRLSVLCAASLEQAVHLPPCSFLLALYGLSRSIDGHPIVSRTASCRREDEGSQASCDESAINSLDSVVTMVLQSTDRRQGKRLVATGIV